MDMLTISVSFCMPKKSNVFIRFARQQVLILLWKYSKRALKTIALKLTW